MNSEFGKSLGDSHERTSALHQMGRYLIVGLLSAGVEYASFAVMLELLSVDISFSSPASLLISTVFNFILSSTWSFKGSSNIARSALLYCLLLAFNMAFSSFGGSMLVSIGVPGLFAKLVTMACVVLWNFVLYRKVVFR